MKIDIELEKTIREFARKNNIRLREASRLIAESLKNNKGKNYHPNSAVGNIGSCPPTNHIIDGLANKHQYGCLIILF